MTRFFSSLSFNVDAIVHGSDDHFERHHAYVRSNTAGVSMFVTHLIPSGEVPPLSMHMYTV